MRLRLIIVLMGVLLVSVVASWFVFLPYYPEAADVVSVLASTDEVLYSHNSWIVFAPNDPQTQVTTGLIIYPGARVSPKAYAPVANAIASEGYLVVIVAMPMHLAVLGLNKADQVRQAHDQVQTWVMAGHSLGGAMAAKYALENPAVNGLVLWAAYPGQNDDLSQWPDPVVSIYGSQDGLATVEKIMVSQELLPDHTQYVEISGGNHAQFGSYGTQRGDGRANISRQEQQEIIVEHTLKLLGRSGVH